MEDRPERLLYDIPEASAMLGYLGRTSVFALMKDGSLERVKIGSRTFVTAESLRNYVVSLARAGAERVGSVLGTKSD